MAAELVRIDAAGDDDAEVRRMLVELALEEQAYFDHPQETRRELEHRLSARSTFTGKNHILVAHDESGRAIGLCWVVLFDPGTGLEAELAELYVQREARGRGVASRLAAEAMRLLHERQVTFACVWTRDDNPAALAAYLRAGFRPTQQTVLTWLPLPE